MKAGSSVWCTSAGEPPACGNRRALQETCNDAARPAGPITGTTEDPRQHSQYPQSHCRALPRLGHVRISPAHHPSGDHSSYTEPMISGFLCITQGNDEEREKDELGLKLKSQWYSDADGTNSQHFTKSGWCKAIDFNESNHIRKTKQLISTACWYCNSIIHIWINADLNQNKFQNLWNLELNWMWMQSESKLELNQIKKSASEEDALTLLGRGWVEEGWPVLVSSHRSLICGENGPEEKLENLIGVRIG